MRKKIEMKKNLVITFGVMLALTLTLSLVVSIPALAQKSTITMGDKNTVDVKKSADIFKKQISDLKKEIVSLKNDKAETISKLERSRDYLVKKDQNLYEQVITDINDSIKKFEKSRSALISAYEKRESNMEDQLLSFTVVAAGKDKQTVVSLKSRNVTRMAEAYRTMKYADNMSVINNGTIMKDSALIQNSFYRETFVTVTGPDFSKNFRLGSKQQIILPINGPGHYAVSFQVGYDIKTVCTDYKGYNKQAIDTKTNREYAFLAELPEW